MSYNILIADDNSTNVELLTCILEKHKEFNLFKASNGIHALEILLHNPISLILLDLSMPVMDGLELMRILKHITKTKNIPVIVISAYHLDEILDPDITAYANNYLQKPVDKNELLNAIHKILN